VEGDFDGCGVYTCLLQQVREFDACPVALGDGVGWLVYADEKGILGGLGHGCYLCQG
jgi:hypothetical protein